MDIFSFSAALIGGVIILALAIYAGWLLAKLNHQTRQRKAFMEKAIQKRNLKIIESIDIIAFAALEQQCDLSEAAIRLYMIMGALQGDKEIDFSHRFPALFELYDLIKDMPRGDERKQVEKKERMQLDLIRVKAEARLVESINRELKDILSFTGAKYQPSED